MRTSPVGEVICLFLILSLVCNHRSAEIKCLQILRNHVLGDRPVQVEYLSDPAKDFAHCNSKCVNYENPNLNIGLPVFSIHGNHDDPSGLGGHSCLDLVHEAGLVNYFGKVNLQRYSMKLVGLSFVGHRFKIYKGEANFDEKR